MNEPAKTQIYVYLPDEAVEVWRPAIAERIGDDTFRIVTQNPDPQDERWQFGTGTIVRCRRQVLSEGEAVLVAVEEVREEDGR